MKHTFEKDRLDDLEPYPNLSDAERIALELYIAIPWPCHRGKNNNKQARDAWYNRHKFTESTKPEYKSMATGTRRVPPYGTR